MKKIISAVYCTLMVLSIYSQQREIHIISMREDVKTDPRAPSSYTNTRFYVKKMQKKLKEQTLLVTVDSPDSDYGKTVKKVFEKYWTYSKFQIVTKEERKKLSENANFALFDLTDDVHDFFGQQDIEVKERFVQIYSYDESESKKKRAIFYIFFEQHFGRQSTGNISKYPTYPSYSGIVLQGSSEFYKGALYILPHILIQVQKELQQQIDDTKTDETKGKNGELYYGTGKDSIAGKTVCVLDTICKMYNVSEDKIKKGLLKTYGISSDKIKFVTKDEIQKMIEEKNNSVLLCYTMDFQLFTSSGTKLAAISDKCFTKKCMFD